MSLISPLLKPGKDTSKPSSYRPVTLTELWIPILEKILKKELQWHAERLGLLSEDQHGFRRKKSTGSNLLEHHQRIVDAMGRGETNDAIYIDLSRVVHRVSHTRLIKKLKQARFHGDVLAFSFNFLNGRKQVVYANGQLSEPLPVTSGTPQGATLSPLYFAIFIASIADCVDQELEEEATEEGREKIARKLAKIWSLLFADDTKIASSLKSNKEMKTLKRLLSRIYQWVDDHKMVVNPDKTEHIRFGKLPMEEE